MNKMIFAIGMYLIFAHQALGQSKTKRVDILWGPQLKESRTTTLHDIVGYDENGIYVIKEENISAFRLSSSYVLANYDNEMAPVGSYKIELQTKKKKRNFEFSIQIDNILYFFSSFKNQKQKKNYLFLQTFDKKNLGVRDDLQMIAEIDYAGNSKYNPGSFNYKLSNDKSKVLIYYSLPYNKGQNEKFGINIFDNEFNLLWKKRITLPFKDELFKFSDYEIDNYGNVYLLGKLTQKKSKFERSGTPNFKYMILGYSADSLDANVYRVEVEGKFLTDMQIAINEDGDIICAGFYSSGENFNIEGSYFLKINGRSKEIVSKAYKEFGVDFINQYMSQKEERKAQRKAKKGKNTALYQYDLDDIILRDDGGAILVGEQYYIKVSTSSMYSPSGGMSTVTTYEYYYNDIIVINMSSEGKIEWTIKIPKKQVTINDGGFYSSYAYAVVKDKIYFIFNDNPKNLLYNGEGKLYKFMRQMESLAVLVTVDIDGSLSREALYSSKANGILIRPEVCEQINEHEMVLYGEHGKNKRFAKLYFKD